MQIEQLRYFMQAVESGSVNSVAQKFYMTPQAINASLHRLEKEFGTKLLERNKKGITLTPQGSFFMEYAQRVLEQYEKIQIFLQEYDNKKDDIVGTLPVYSSSVFTEQFLPTQINKFMEIYPHALVKIVMAEAKNVLELFQCGYSKIAFLSVGSDVIEDYLQQNADSTICWLPLVNDDIVLCGKTDHPLMRESVIEPEMLEIYMQQNVGQISFYHIMNGRTFGSAYPKVVCDSNTVELHKNLILEHGIVTCMPKMAYQHQFQKENFVAVPFQMKNTVIHGLLYRNDPESEDYALLQCFVNSLQRHFVLRYGEYK